MSTRPNPTITWEGEPAARFPLPTLAAKDHGSLLPFTPAQESGVRPGKRLSPGPHSIGSPAAGHGARSPLVVPALALALALGLAASACGTRGALLPPLSNKPSAPTDATLVQRGETMIITWKNPTTFIDGNPLKGLSAIEVWLAVDIIDPTQTSAPRPLTSEDFAGRARFLASLGSDQFSGAAGEKAATKPSAPGAADKKKRSKEQKEGLTLRYEYVMTTEKPGATRLIFGLRAVDLKERESDFDVLPGFVPRPLPSPPEGLQGTVKNDSVTLTWKAPADNIDKSKPPKVQGYNVYRSVDGAPAVRINTELLTKTELVDTTFEFGKETVYTVRAAAQPKEPYGESDDSVPFRVRPRDVFPPAAPTGLAAVAGPGFISLSWDANTERDLAGYRVWRRIPGEAAYSELTTAPLKGTTFQDDTAAPGRKYEYVVTSEDAAGNRSEYSKPASEQLKGK